MEAFLATAYFSKRWGHFSEFSFRILAPFFETEEVYMCKTHKGPAGVPTTPKKLSPSTLGRRGRFRDLHLSSNINGTIKLLTKAPAETLLRV